MLNIKYKALKAFTITSVLFFASTLYAAGEKKYTIATASTAGTYYPVGVGIATIASLKLAKANKLTFSAITSAGSGENINMLGRKEVNFAIIQGLYGDMAWKGLGPYKNKAKKNLRSVSMLWQNVEQFTIFSDLAKTGNIKDIKNLYGKKFGIGGRNSGSRVSSENILLGLGINPEKLNVQYTSYGSSADGMKDRKISGMNTPAGTPTSAVTSSFATLDNEITVLNFSDEDIKTLQKKYAVWTRFVIPANTYPSQKKAINTIAQPNILVVTEDTPEEVVYLLTKTIYENLTFLNSVHAATKAMDINKAIDGMPMPLHPGAVRYYKEKGIKIPKHLILK